MFRYHYRNKLHSCRTFCQPSIGIIHGQLRSDPARGPLWGYKIPELVKVPESIPESITTKCYIITAFKLLYLFSCINPFSINITENIPAANGSVHIGIKAEFFTAIIGCNFKPAQQTIPDFALVIDILFQSSSQMVC